MRAFSHKEFWATDHHAIFNCQRLPPLPKEATADELGARQNFLGCLNASITIEAILRQAGSNSPMAPPLSAALKATLQPLWTAFCLFSTKRIHLRERALKGCFRESQLVQKLVESNPLSETLFDQEVVDEVFQQAEHQAKSIASLLTFKPPFKRKRSTSRCEGTPRYPRMRAQQRGGHRGQHQSPYRSPYHGQGFQQQQQNQYQSLNGQGYQGQASYNPTRGYPSTPRRWNYRGRGLGGRSPGTPKSPSAQQGGKQGF